MLLRAKAGLDWVSLGHRTGIEPKKTGRVDRGQIDSGLDRRMGWPVPGSPVIRLELEHRYLLAVRLHESAARCADWVVPFPRHLPSCLRTALQGFCQSAILACSQRLLARVSSFPDSLTVIIESDRSLWCTTQVLLHLGPTSVVVAARRWTTI